MEDGKWDLIAKEETFAVHACRKVYIKVWIIELSETFHQHIHFPIIKYTNTWKWRGEERKSHLHSNGGCGASWANRKWFSNWFQFRVSLFGWQRENGMEEKYYHKWKQSFCVSSKMTSGCILEKLMINNLSIYCWFNELYEISAWIFNLDE